MALERKVSYFVFALLALAVVLFQLGAALLAGVIALSILEAADRFTGKWLGNKFSKPAALIFFFIAATLLFWSLADFVRLAALRAPLIVSLFVPRLKAIADQWGVSLPFDNLDDLRFLIAHFIAGNVPRLTHASSLLTRGFLQVALAVFSSLACFWNQGKPASVKKSGFAEALGNEMALRMRLFMDGFKKAFGAQFTISLINTGMVSFLLLILQIPYVRFLVSATFILGLLPVVGGAVTNIAIVSAALTVSPKTALIALIALIILHHAQYPIQGQVMGQQMKIPVWQILVGLILGEAILGIAGMVLAPAVIAYFHSELSLIP